MRVLGYSWWYLGWLLGWNYAVAKVFWVVARVLLCGCYGTLGGCYRVAMRLLGYSGWLLWCCYAVVSSSFQFLLLGQLLSWQSNSSNRYMTFKDIFNLCLCLHTCMKCFLHLASALYHVQLTVCSLTLWCTLHIKLDLVSSISPAVDAVSTFEEETWGFSKVRQII